MLSNRSKDQVNKLARDLRPFSYFSDKPSIATTSDIKDLQNDISERRNDFQVCIKLLLTYILTMCSSSCVTFMIDSIRTGEG